MLLLEDNEILKIINDLRSQKRIKSFKTNDIPKFFFVCGKHISDSYDKDIASQNKDQDASIRHYTVKQLNNFNSDVGYLSLKKRVYSIISEELYDDDLADDILSFEKMLAEISDNIIIIVESWGSACELGAFSIVDDIMNKVLVVNKEDPEYEKSFISLGPIRKIKLKSSRDDQKIILHSGIDYLAESSAFQGTINKLASTPVDFHPNSNEKELSIKSLIYEFINIVELFQPLDDYEIFEIYKLVCDITVYKIRNCAEHKIRSFADVIDLMRKMKLLEKRKGYYYCNDSFTAYNALFSITRKQFNESRIKYLMRLRKKFPNRGKYYVS